MSESTTSGTRALVTASTSGGNNSSQKILGMYLKKKSNQEKKPKFIGDTPEMQGHVFQLYFDQRSKG